MTRSGFMDDYTDESEHKSPKKKKGWLLPVIIGITVGAILMFILYPNITNNGDLTDDEESTEEKKAQESPTKQGQLQVDVSTQITDVVDDVSATVVGVTNIQQQADFWSGDEADEAGTGSGVIYKKDNDYAYIVTNNHVVEQADVVEIIFKDETNLEAEILGTDLFSDLAVLRVDGEQIDKVIEMGTSDSLKVGEPAIAIGNPLGHMFAGSVTQGIISGKQRTIPQDFNQDGRADWQAEVIQTDAAINPGNSGGALINIEGQLIGINSMKINQEAVEGIGFAIPIDTAGPIIDELEKTGEVKRPYLGVEIYSLDEVPQTEWKNTLNLPKEVEGGVYVWSVEPLSPADQVGLERLDVITELDGEEIMNMIDLRKILYQEKEIGDDVKVTYYRDGEKKETTVKLGGQE